MPTAYLYLIPPCLYFQWQHDTGQMNNGRIFFLKITCQSFSNASNGLTVGFLFKTGKAGKLRKSEPKFYNLLVHPRLCHFQTLKHFAKLR